MASAQLTGVLRHLRRTALLSEGAAQSDGDLLDRYLMDRDEAAFEALLVRHGAMVLGVCRRILRNEADAQDAFQATFLVFLRKASSIEPRAMVGNWLYGVASRTSLKARAMNRRRGAREAFGAAQPCDESREQELLELQALLDQELARLPDRYRAAVVLCELEGKSIREAAQQLGCPPGTVASRLARGRGMLARRLARLGSFSAGTLALLLEREVAAAGVPSSLFAATVRSMTALAAGQAATAGLLSSKVLVLAEGVMKTMLLTKLKPILVSLTVCLLLGTAGTQAVYRASGAEQEQPRQAPPVVVAEVAEKPGPQKEKAEKPTPPERTWGYLGVMLSADDDHVVIHEVFPDSPAAKAGVKEGDIVVEVAGKPATDPLEVAKQVKSTKPGDKLAITLKRGDKESKLTITLGKWPADLTEDGRPRKKETPEAGKQPGYLGLELRDDTGKVVVQRPRPESPAARAGVEPEDVILQIDRVAVTGAKNVIERLSNLKEGDKVTVRIRRGDKEMDLPVTAARRPADFGKE
jgi:RNA polymerase sigma factor (sigma-70 family)